MDLADKELVDEFVIESQEGLSNVENQMLEIESKGADIDTDLVNAVFRTMHSIKGASGFLGLDSIGALAHGLEEILDFMRNRELVPTSELVTTVLKAADYMEGLISAIETSDQADISPYISELKSFHPGDEPVESAAAPAEEQPTSEPEEKPAVESVAATTSETLAAGNADEPSASSGDEGKEPPALSDSVREFLIECFENLEQMDHDLLEVEKDPSAEELFRNIFRTIHTIKGGAGFLALSRLERLTHVAENLLSSLRNGERKLNSTIVNVLLSTVDKCKEGLHLVEQTGSDEGLDPDAVIEQIKAIESNDSPKAEKPPELEKPAPRAAKPPVEPPKKQPAKPTPAQPASSASSQSGEKTQVSAAESTVRVDVGLLDKLMTRVGELVLARNQILQHTNQQEDSTFTSTAQRLNLITTELQEDVMKTRMQPIGNVWAKFPRVVRDLSSQLGKQVRIEMEGRETELDKTIVEAIKDPLTHLVRNSVDHGIETPEVREAGGKEAEGCLTLRAYHEGGQVIIEVADDGAGLNIDRIRDKAVERGLVSADDAMRLSDREAAQLIMAPGFSTAQQVTSVSGRGVGMNVVKTNIERIGGTIDVDTDAGTGTTVNIKIPLTLAIIPALVVTDGGDRYAIPQVSLLELVRLEGKQIDRGIEFIHGAAVYRLRGQLLPLVNLSDRLGIENARPDLSEENTDDKVVNIVVLRANDRQFGLVVEGVNDTEEIVVKPLSRQLKNLSEYAGATIMGDGTVALILDVAGLAATSGLAGERHSGDASASGKHENSGDDKQRLLIVDLGDTRRFALPTSMVSRLEKVPRQSIEYSQGGEVIQYRGAIMPLIRLDELFGRQAGDRDESGEVQIVVYADEKRNYGLVVNRIVDVVETELSFETGSSDDNILGAAVIQDCATDVLNLCNVVKHQSRTMYSGL